MKLFLGMDIYCPDPTGPIFINQAIYAHRTLHELGMERCNPAKTLFSSTTQLKQNEEATETKPYRNCWKTNASCNIHMPGYCIHYQQTFTIQFQPFNITLTILQSIYCAIFKESSIMASGSHLQITSNHFAFQMPPLPQIQMMNL